MSHDDLFKKEEKVQFTVRIRKDLYDAMELAIISVSNDMKRKISQSEFVGVALLSFLSDNTHSETRKDTKKRASTR